MKLARLAKHLRHQHREPEAPPEPAVAYQLSRARREHAAAELARLALLARARELFDVAAVSECLAGAPGIIRRELGPLPREIAAAVLPLAGDEIAIKAVMEERIAAALVRLADHLEKAAKQP